jgi:predicted lipoprotein with Yx(FWY)xxD motif
VLGASGGHTIYLFTADKGKSACYGQCAAYWPPLIASHASVGPGLKASLLGSTRRRDGEQQITYAGHPLYYFAEDKKASDVNGEGVVHFGGSWWAVSATGAQVKPKH